jgi:acyl carrier protein
MNLETLQEAKQLLSEALVCDIFEIPDDASFDNFSMWDSLGHMRIISALEQHMGVILASDQMLEIIDIKAICKLLNNNKNNHLK